MIKMIMILFILLLVVNIGYTQNGTSHPLSFVRDTTIVGKVIATDSIFTIVNSNRFGTIYYYGVHHFKIAVIDVRDSLVKDTVILAYVYNVKSEHALYMNNFDLKTGKSYIFDISAFMPCSSDFPKIEGVCSTYGSFSPISDKLIKHYKKIYRIINSTIWRGTARE